MFVGRNCVVLVGLTVLVNTSAFPEDRINLGENLA